MAVASAAAAAIHFSVIAEHWRESMISGAFFLVVGLFQATWAGIVLRTSSRWWCAVGVVGNAAIILTWILSRTAGVPWSVPPGAVEPLGMKDLLATIYEVAIAGGALSLSAAGIAHPPSGAGARKRLTTLVFPAAILAPVTLAAVLYTGAGNTTSHGSHAGAVLGHHVFHLIFIAAATIVFLLAVALDVWRHGWPGFSWRLTSGSLPDD